MWAIKKILLMDKKSAINNMISNQKCLTKADTTEKKFIAFIYIATIEIHKIPQITRTHTPIHKHTTFLGKKKQQFFLFKNRKNIDQRKCVYEYKAI